MKIGVDCHVLAGKYQGSRTYITELYKAVLTFKQIDDFIFLGHWGEKCFGTNSTYAEYESESRWKRLTYQTAPLVRNLKLDVLHSNYIAPLLLPCRSLLTIHDILYETHPQFFSRSEVLRNKILVKHSVKHATLIHTVSEFSRNALIDIYHIPEEMICIVPDGVDLSKFTPANHKTTCLEVEKEFHISDYILSVGRLEPRKNHAALLRAYALVRQHRKDVGPLVFVGQKDFRYKEFFDTLDELKLWDNVKIFESVTDDWLPSIYRAARLFVYPSFAEGFGIPPLEAMASGVPTITSNTSALPEVVNNAGLLVNPCNYEEIAEAMLNVISDQGLAENLIKKGRNQAEKWTWHNAAKTYIKSLEKLRK